MKGWLLLILQDYERKRRINKQIKVENIIEIKQKRSILIIGIVLLLLVFVAPYSYSFYSSEELSILLHLLLIFFIVFLTISFIDGYFTRIILTEDAIIKKSLLIKKIIELDKITEARVLKYQNSIIVNTKNKRLGIGWDYERHQKFKELLIKELEKRQIPIVYKNEWW